MQITFVPWSQRLTGGGGAVKKSRVFEWHKRFKESSHVEITNKDHVRHFFQLSKVLFTLNSFQNASQPSSLCGNIQAVTWSCAYKKAWTLAQRLVSPPWQCFNSQGALRQAVSGPKKSITDMSHSPYSLDLVPNDFWLFPKIYSALKGRKFPDTENIRKMWRRHWKAIPQQKFQKCFQQW
jgi:hypothetical protein